MSRAGVPNIVTRLIVDDYGTAIVYRRCSGCRSWRPQAIGHFSPRKRDDKRRVVRWDGRCLDCRANERRRNWHNKTREERRAISRGRWEKIKADPELLAERREANRQLMARRMRDPALVERAREQHRAYYQRVKADPEKHAQHLERARMNYRLRQERAGRSLGELRVVTTAIRPADPVIARLPAKALANAIDDHVRTFHLDEVSRETFLAGMGIEPRSLRAWRAGERETVQFNVADVALTRLGLAWWDVWPPADFPDVAMALDADFAATDFQLPEAM